MYKYELPEELISDVKAVFERNKDRIVMVKTDLEYLMGLYYRYCVRLNQGQTVKNLVTKGMKCMACKGKVIYYFKNKLSEW